MLKDETGILRLKAALLLLCILFVIILPATAGAQQERIKDFHSRILVNPDATLTITETITVYCNQQHIIHGIFRELPLAYMDIQGKQQEVDYRVNYTGLNGGPVKRHFKKDNETLLVYLGDPDITLDSGEYEYTLTYTTANHLRSYKNQALLYYNATGNGWEFPIESTSVEVELPAEYPSGDVSLDSYAGRPGSTENDCDSSYKSKGICRFNATRRIQAGEGLTIVVQFPGSELTRTSAAGVKGSSVPMLNSSIMGTITTILLVILAIGLSMGQRWYRSRYGGGDSSSGGFFSGGSSGGGSGGGGGGGW